MILSKDLKRETWLTIADKKHTMEQLQKLNKNISEAE